jgi:hypothetical protein
MENVAGQVHNKFKVFSGTLGADRTMGGLAREVESWVRSAKVAPKSIGVEYVEAAGRLLLSIGYRDDEPGYAVALTTVEVGRIEALDAPGLAKVEQAMAAATAKLNDVICHELYVTGSNELLMVFMTRAAE